MDELETCYYNYIETIKSELFQNRTKAVMVGIFRGNRSQLYYNLKNDNFPVPKAQTKGKISSRNASTCDSDSDSEEFCKVVSMNFEMEKHQQFKLDSNVPNGTDYKHVPSTEKGYFYKSQKERLILEDLAKLKQGMKTAFTEKEYQAFCRWS